MDNISIIIPARNEKLSLGKVLEEIKKYNFINEIIVVVDNYDDSSIEPAKLYNCKIIIQKSKGYGSAIKEGFENASNEFGCIFNADYSFDPIYLEKMINKSKKYKFIFGTRYKNEGRSDDDDIITLVGNKIFSFMSKYLLRINLSDILYTYVLCNVKDFRKLDFSSKDFRLCIELPFKVSKYINSYCEIPMIERKRYAGKKNVNVIKDGFLILLEIIKSVFIKRY